MRRRIAIVILCGLSEERREMRGEVMMPWMWGHARLA